jgi:hypothetical protein
VLDPAYGGGDFAVSGLADEPGSDVTEGGHDAGPRACPDLGGILTTLRDALGVTLDGSRPLVVLE